MKANRGTWKSSRPSNVAAYGLPRAVRAIDRAKTAYKKILKDAGLEKPSWKDAFIDETIKKLDKKG